MTPVDGLILGLIEGFTEFIPVSSTGHLILARSLLNLQVPEGLAIDAILNMAAVAAILVYFFKDILRIISGTLAGNKKERTLLLALILGTVPAVCAGLLFENVIETTLRSPIYVALGLVVGSLFFIAAERYAHGKHVLTVGRGFVIGAFQALSLIPGMSRSGMSIVGGLFMGLTREEATRFAFLLSAPIIFGAGGRELLDLSHSGVLRAQEMPILIAALAAFVAGLASIRFMLTFLRTNSLMPFVWYRVALATLIVVVMFI